MGRQMGIRWKVLVMIIKMGRFGGGFIGVCAGKKVYRLEVEICWEEIGKIKGKFRGLEGKVYREVFCY